MCTVVLADHELHADIEDFLDAMPERYILANDPIHIATHARLVLSLETGNAGEGYESPRPTRVCRSC